MAGGRMNLILRRVFLSLLIILSIIFVFWLRESFLSTSLSNERVPVTIGSKVFNVEIVSTYKGYIKGLSSRKALAEDEGMLFVFKTSGYYPIWMKDMIFGIDIIWVDEKSRIIDIKENVLPACFPKAFYPSKPARYVLEVSAGEVKKSNATIGSTISGLAN